MQENTRLPLWLRKNKRLSDLRGLKVMLRRTSLSTVCEEARCPNISECFSVPTATFLILGDTCTRACRFCSIKKGTPSPPSKDEPFKVAKAAYDLGLRHVVITSVTRDDLADKGAMQFVKTIEEVRRLNPGATIEVLTPDFGGRGDLLRSVLDVGPDVFNHNVETVRRLHHYVRPGADIDRSIDILKLAKSYSPGIVVKSGFMVGLGETQEEIVSLIASLRYAGVDVVTIGQYMRPTLEQLPVERYWEPRYFDIWAGIGKSMGIKQVISGPFVRSSYRAKEILKGMGVKDAVH
ncbi:MAG: lipoyl synthase [Deltaproteobacteria bacterium]|nr:MAG: lipoyl synthase [Deltaproteobacteria bacterium]